MRLNEYITKDKDRYLLIMEDTLKIPDCNKILQKSWIIFRESLSNDDQCTTVKIINKNFNTNYKNIYFIKKNDNLKEYTPDKILVDCCKEVDKNIVKSEYYKEDYDLEKHMVRGLMWLYMNLKNKGE